MNQIFLSYAREDRERVEALYQELSEAGFKPWMDKKSLLPGEQWKSRIPQAIRDSDFFLACLSSNSVSKRGFLQREINDALDIWREKLDSDIYLVPARLEDCEVPERLRDFQWVNLFEESGWTRLVKAIEEGIRRRAQGISSIVEGSSIVSASYQADEELPPGEETVSAEKSTTRIAPDMIGPYEILQELGHGGYATVYLAQGRVSDKNQLVALKVLDVPAVRDREKVERFKLEARILTELRHPNIIKILDTGDDGRAFFIAMEYISGGTLSERLKTGPLSVDMAVHIVKRIGAALIAAHTHEQQIIHRDLKPGNVLLDTRKKRLQPILTDFGLIKQLVSDDASPLTGSNDILGTPPYMAPEQCEQGVLTPLTDLYVLGIILFEMLAGWLPLKRIPIYQPLPTLSSVAPDVGPFFDAVLAQATAREPADRFPSVAHFVQALDAANEEAQYAAIVSMAKNGQIDRAIEELEEKFIRPRKNYRNSLSLLDDLLYAKENDDQMPPGWASGVEKEGGHRKLEKQHEINKYIIPVSIAVAMIAGGIIVPQLEGLDLGVLFVVSVIAFVLLLAYFLYYLWVYHFSSSDK